MTTPAQREAARCSKCGSLDLLVRWHKSALLFGGKDVCNEQEDASFLKQEHLHYYCRTCSFDWTDKLCGADPCPRDDGGLHIPGSNDPQYVPVREKTQGSPLAAPFPGLCEPGCVRRGDHRHTGCRKNERRSDRRKAGWDMDSLRDAIHERFGAALGIGISACDRIARLALGPRP